MDCPSVQDTLEAWAASGKKVELEAELREHLKTCPDCAGTYELLSRMEAMTTDPEPSDADFQAMRRSVLRDIRLSKTREPNLKTTVLGLLRKPTFAYAVAACLVLGVLFLHRVKDGGLQEAPRAQDTFLAQLQQAATRNQQSESPERSLYHFSNVSAEDLGNGNLALRFDVSRQVELTLPRSHPLVGEVLLQTLQNPNSVGDKLSAISLTGKQFEPRIREALIQAMLTDPNLGVRLKAQARLLEGAADSRLNDALLRVLQNEESVQMKLVAIDHLTRHRVDPVQLQRAVPPPAQPDAVYLKAMNYLNEQGVQP